MIDSDIAAVLNADPVIATNLTGRVWDRPILRRGPFATPEAFNAVAPHNVLPAAVVTNAPEQADVNGARGCYEGMLTVWLHGPTGLLASAAMDAAARQIIRVLSHTVFPAPDGSGILFEAGDRFGLRDDPIIPGTQLDYVRFATAGVWT